MKRYLALIPVTLLAITACGDNKQAELEQQLKAQQEQIAKQQAQLEAMQKQASAPANAQDQTVYQLQPQAEETMMPFVTFIVTGKQIGRASCRERVLRLV